MLRSTRSRIAFGCALALGVPRVAAAQLFQASSGFAFARIFESPADVQATQGANDLAVTIAAESSNVLELPDEQWLLDFTYEADVLGAGSVTWGSASGNLALDTSSLPQSSPPAPGSSNGPQANGDSAQAGGTVHLRFNELGTITSATLAAGTPVSVELNCRVDSLGSVSGTLDPPDETRVGASAECRITDNSGGFVRAEIFVSGNEVETKSLASAVGHVLEIEGVFRVTGEAFAGPSSCCPGYLGEASADIQGSSGLWLGLPQGVGVAAASGHDYTVPVPEPAVVPSALAVALSLFGVQWRRAARRPAQAASRSYR
jgi:hypothetical protein